MPDTSTRNRLTRMFGNAARPADLDDAPGQVWTATSVATRCPDGFLVTYAGHLHRPIAWVEITDEFPAEQARRLAVRIARDPAFSHRSGYCIGLLPHPGVPRSEMPAWVYTLRCRPLGGSLAEEDVCCPCCPLRYLRMMRAAFTKEERRAWRLGNARDIAATMLNRLAA